MPAPASDVPLAAPAAVDVTLAAVLAGPAAVLADDPRRGRVRSGIAKGRLAGPVRVGIDGIEGDEQADRRHHGGPDKAVHHYALDHYPFFRARLGDLPPLGTPGAFGENFSTTGLREAGLCIGDVLRAGTVLLQVSQGRQPCWKLNLRFGVPGISRLVQQTCRTGWYYRVLEAGVVEPGDAMTLVERTAPAWTVERGLRLIFRDHPADATPGDVRAWTADLAALPALSASWRATLQGRLAGGDRSTDRARLDGR